MQCDAQLTVEKAFSQALKISENREINFQFFCLFFLNFQLLQIPVLRIYVIQAEKVISAIHQIDTVTFKKETVTKKL